jgi:hypothetical protein
MVSLIPDHQMTYTWHLYPCQSQKRCWSSSEKLIKRWWKMCVFNQYPFWPKVTSSMLCQQRFFFENSQELGLLEKSEWNNGIFLHISTQFSLSKQQQMNVSHPIISIIIH